MKRREFLLLVGASVTAVGIGIPKITKSQYESYKFWACYGNKCEFCLYKFGDNYEGFCPRITSIDHICVYNGNRLIHKHNLNEKLPMLKGDYLKFVLPNFWS